MKLPVTAGEKPNTSTVMLNFLVVKGNGLFNSILGRPTLKALKAISSIYHQVIKFPTSSGIGIMKSNKYESRITYSKVVTMYSNPLHKVRMVQTTPASEQEDLDPRGEEDMQGTKPVEDLEEIPID